MISVLVAGAMLIHQVGKEAAGRERVARSTSTPGSGPTPFPDPTLGGTPPTGSVDPPVPSDTATSVPTHVTPIVDPSRTRTSRPTATGPKPPTHGGQPWVAPAGTQEWTLHDTDGIRFLPTPAHLPETGYGELTFQADMHQINWYQWTDSPDLSYQGCRDTSAPRWDGLKLDLFTAPRTYCRQEPSDPSTVSYVQFVAKDMAANPPYVRVRVWVYSP